MRILYSILWVFVLPLAFLRLFWRGRLEPGYRRHIAERLGFFPADNKSSQPMLWVHAVSVGETRAVEPVIRQLQQHYPQYRILLTHMTPTGRATGATLFPNNEVQQCYLPYDIPILIDRLLQHFQPMICILMETEVWPNLIYTCKKRHIPVVIINARLSEKSYRQAQRYSALIRPACAAISSVLAQTEIDANRIRQLGTPNVVVTGSTKFDLKISPEQVAAGQQLRQQWGNRTVLVCASTREDEEQLILDAFIHAQKASPMPHLLLVIVPRHPQRFELVEQLIKQRGLKMERRTALTQNQLSSEVQVVLGDSMGELVSYYMSADVAFIGGSLLPLGGHNLIEALAVEKPVIIGPHTFNFEVITNNAIDADCTIRVKNADDLMQEAIKLIQDKSRKTAMGKNALNFANQHRGATERTIKLLRQYIH